MCGLAQRVWTDARNSHIGLLFNLPMGVLVAISIPIFTSQLEKAREATDAANLRSAYAVAAADVLDGDGDTGYSAGPVAMAQTTAGFASSGLKDDSIGGIKLSTLTDTAKGVSYYVNVTKDGTVTITTTATTGNTVVDPITGKTN